MDFNLKERAATFARAMKPSDIRAETKNWTKLESYVYVISKRMSVKADDGDAINLVKVGMSNLTTKEKTGKGYARLLSFRTSLLSFLVHRIYLFDDSDIDPSQDPDQPFGLNAYLAEQLLHFQIDDKFPQAKRIKFANGLPSEWFHVPDKHMPAFTKFLDTKVQLDSPIAPAYGTAFSRDSFKRIQFPQRKQGVGVEIVGGRAQRRKVYRITQNRYARNARVRNTQIEIEYKKNEAKELNAKERKALAKSVEFWEKVLVGKTFTDKKMYADLDLADLAAIRGSSAASARSRTCSKTQGSRYWSPMSRTSPRAKMRGRRRRTSTPRAGSSPSTRRCATSTTSSASTRTRTTTTPT